MALVAKKIKDEFGDILGELLTYIDYFGKQYIIRILVKITLQKTKPRGNNEEK